MKKVIITILFGLFVFTLNATVIDIPDDYSTIQEGINAVTNGDTVLVQPGTYVENINYNGKNITVASLFLTTQDTSYISQTIIDGNSSGSVVTFENGEDTTAVLNGFTIQNGNAVSGGGIYCENSSPLITYSFLTNNAGVEYGGGIYCNSSNAKIIYVTIQNNSTNYGGGLSCNNSNIYVENVEIKNNFANAYGGGIYCYLESEATFKSVLLSNNSSLNYGGGICCWHCSDPILENLTISKNSASYGGGCYSRGTSYPILRNCIVSDNNADYGINVHSGSPKIEYCDFFNNGIGNFYGTSDSIGVNVTTNINGDSCDIFYNIQIDPLFIDLENNNFNLSENSPCIDAGDPDTIYTDPDGSISDIGTYYYYQTKADFEANITNGCNPLKVDFMNKSFGILAGWNWDFQNDGIIDSYEKNPSYTYNDTGIYSVKLMVFDSTKTDTLVKEDYITVYLNPEPVIMVNPDSLYFGNVCVDSTATLPLWVHNYGATDLEVSNILCSTDKFTISLPQTKDISFTVSSLDSQQVNIHFTPVDTVDYTANLIFFSNDPDNGMLLTDVYGTGYEFYAQFGTDQTTGDVPLEVTFMDSSAGDIVSWHWDFGDGDSSTVQNPVHSYQYDGVYDVSLTVQDNYHSNTITKTDYITAIGHPEIYTPDSLGFEYGVVYLSDVSGDSIIVIENTGTDTVLVSDVSFINDTNGFHYTYDNLGNPLSPNCLDTLYVNFEPLLVQTYEDTILITNNSENKPLLKIPLYGIGEYVPPAPPTGVTISIDSLNAVITWNPVDTTIYGTPITPDGYIILYSEIPDEEYYWFLAFTTQVSYTHFDVAQYRDHMYYKVVAYKDFGRNNTIFLNNLTDSKKRMSWIELRDLLSRRKIKKTGL